MQEKEPRFGYLLTGLIAYLLAGPIARELFGDMQGLIMMLALSGILVIGIFSLQESRALFVSGILLATLSIALTALSRFMPDHDAILLIALVISFTFFVMSIGLAARHLFKRGPVTLNRIFCGICIYILLGMCWGIVYMFINWSQPHAFNGPVFDTADNPLYWDMVYFSFVTLTTLGYGDITPVAPMARALAYTEAVVGQLYIAVLIGALVGNFTGRLKD